MSTTITFTDNELNLIRTAIEMHNDMKVDMIFDDSLPYLREGETSEFDYDKTQKIRKEVTKEFEDYLEFRLLLNKLKIRVNHSGYSA